MVFSVGGEFVGRGLGVGLSGAKNDGGKLRVMQGVGKMLGLQTETAVLSVVDTAMAALRSIQPITGVDLHTRLGGPYFHHPSGGPLVDGGASRESLPAALEDEIVIIANGLSGQSSQVSADRFPLGKVERRASHRHLLASGNRGGVHWDINFRGELQFVAENATATGEVEITMVGQVDRGGAVGGGGVVNPQLVAIGKGHQHGDGKIPGVPLLPMPT